MLERPRDLAAWLHFIDGTHPREVALGLDRVRQVAERLAVVPPAPLNLVVAGTNGKGSTCAFAESLLETLGFRTGLTTSPHLEAFNERIRIGGRELSDADICAAMDAVETAREGVELTYFEYAILAALVAFSRAAVDVAVLEVGLGGRLDAVNVVDADVAVITSIGLDHMDYLGSDLDGIGAEKAGILRRGVPVVCGPDVTASVLQRARELGAPVHRPGPEVAAVEGSSIAPINAALACHAVALLIGRELEPATVVAAHRRTHLAGRFERIASGGREVIVDVAHNPHGAAFLAKQLAELHPAPTVALAGFLKDKDVAGIVGALDGQIQDWTFVGTGSARGQSGADSLKAIATNSRVRATEAPVAEALDTLLNSSGDERVVVLGSFDVVRRARRHLLSTPNPNE